jgi:ribosomal protein L11 methyltransferase
MRGPRKNNWKVSLKVAPEFLDEFMTALDSISPVLLMNEIEHGEDKGLWLLEAISQDEPKKEDIVAALSIASSICNIEQPEFSLTDFEEKDWLKESLISFPPVSIGSFYIYGSHIKEEPPKDVIALKIDAATAFGSGEHQTTKGCLMALEEMSKKTEFKNILDMGCGSGILSLGAAKICKTNIHCVDIDEESVRVTSENAAENKVDEYISAVTGDGYKDPSVPQKAPYDLIMANILARPLVEMSKDLYANLADGGYAILSGLLEEQEEWVRGAHEEVGLKHIKTYHVDGWCAILMQK